MSEVLKTDKEIELAEEIGRLKRNQFTAEELEYLKDATEAFDSDKFTEELQRGVFMKILYLIDLSKK